MKLGSLASARPAYYDRNAASVLQTYSATPGPHGYTTRWTYTVAAGKKLIVEASSITMGRSTIATVAGQYYTQISTFVGADSQLIGWTASVDNTVGLPNFVQMATQATIYAAEVVSCATQDPSTGGTVNFLASLKGTLFDA